MEYRIRIFAKRFAIFMAIWFAVLTSDDFLPLTEKLDLVKSKYSEEVYDRYGPKKEYYINTSNVEGLSVPHSVFDSVQYFDMVTLYRTPIFHQVRNFDIQYLSKFKTVSVGFSDDYKNMYLFMGFAVIILSLVSAFLANRFEFQIALFFFAIVIGALRWWLFKT
jgi:hypothetical protein